MPAQPRRKRAPHPSRYVINGESADSKVTYHRTQTTWLPHSVGRVSPPCFKHRCCRFTTYRHITNSASLRGTKQSCAFFELTDSPPDEKITLIATYLKAPDRTSERVGSAAEGSLQFFFRRHGPSNTSSNTDPLRCTTTTCLPGRRFPSTSWWSTFHELLVEKCSRRLCVQIDFDYAHVPFMYVPGKWEGKRSLISLTFRWNCNIINLRRDEPGNPLTLLEEHLMKPKICGKQTLAYTHAYYLQIVLFNPKGGLLTAVELLARFVPDQAGACDCSRRST